MPFDAMPRILTEYEVRDLAILKRARHLVRKRWRWSKYPILYGHCPITALNAAAKSFGGAEFAPCTRIASQIPPNYGRSIVAYNDARSTTHADILKLFDAAIEELESV